MKRLLGTVLVLSMAGTSLAVAAQPPVADAPYLPGFDVAGAATAGKQLTIPPLPPSASPTETSQASTQ